MYEIHARDGLLIPLVRRVASDLINKNINISEINDQDIDKAINDAICLIYQIKRTKDGDDLL